MVNPLEGRALGRFLLRVGGWGGALGFLFSLAFQEWANLPRYVLVCSLFTALITGGFALLPQRWLEPDPAEPPRRAALRMQATWLCACFVLVALGLLVVRLAVGPGALSANSILITGLASLLCTSLAVGRHTAAALVARTTELERAKARAGFLALKAQLQPHTLFNALNTILAQVRPDPEGAEQSLRGLATLLRRILAALDREAWTLEEECDLLRTYLELECSRFGHRLSYAIHLTEEDAARPIPPLLLLPLVENSLKHGFQAKVGPCHVEVCVSGTRIRVLDDGVGRPPEPVEGVGLRTVRQRLGALGGSLSWPQVLTGCEVRLELT